MSTMATNTQPRRQRRWFTEEFRAGAVRLVFDEGKTAACLTASRIGVDPHACGFESADTWFAQLITACCARERSLNGMR